MCEGGRQGSSQWSGGVRIVERGGESGQASGPDQSCCCSGSRRVAEELGACSGWDGGVHGSWLAHWSVKRCCVSGRGCALGGVLPCSFRGEPLLLNLLAFALVSAVLEPDLDLGLCQLQQGCQLLSLVSSEVLLDGKSPLQFVYLPMRKESSRSSFLSGPHYQ